MTEISLVFPHQLFEKSPLIKIDCPIYLIEEYLFFKQYNFHKQKITFHRSTMKFYSDYLKKLNKKVIYIESNQDKSDVRVLINNINTKKINYIDPTDNWLEKRIINTSKKKNIKLKKYENLLFLNKKEENKTFFDHNKKKFLQTRFYKQERIKRKILIEESEKPVGGKWTFDKENRKKYPRKKTPPAIYLPKKSKYFVEAIKYVETNFNNNIGEINKEQIYPICFESSQEWFKQFLDYRFYDFGIYEDAIVKNENILNHSVLTPMLNIGLISPQSILDQTIKFSESNNIPINSTEGFIRQIIGWREFIRGIYECKGSQERTTNFWNFKRKIPESFYNASTGIEPIDNTINKILKTGYCHHIERLMVLGNFMFLCEFDPDEVYKWFMELFIDSYDWVMVTNVYGMSQFADGGLMASKPYISGSNYIIKMSDYKKSDWQEIWDSLFWRFMNKKRNFFLKNPRMGMLIKTYEKMSLEKQNKISKISKNYLENLV